MREMEQSEKKLYVTIMRILIWTCGVTMMDRIRNERILWATKVGAISKKEVVRIYVMGRDEE